ncbi:hypothetical protein BV25DRAFT_1804047 [Artomyces pyxidatus]|uniref:Uncharacterized protein n=1 Tax=Artomyces pyxidatus TaxID=48021 RepID=A0ACB8T2D7_9AGAM|nr:hypothetical protein BV25DRAFT_1804047 [Artomyces pyxidatus]
MSNASVYSTQSSTAVDPYTSRRLRQTPSEPSSSFTSPRVESNGAPAQTLSFSAPTHPPYAPSPSLLGTNDPLGRTGSRAPVMSFGFGGKFVTCCHGATTLNTGFDVALSSRQTTSIQVRLLHTVIPESALDTSSTPFPGPLFSDPGSPVTGLVRPGASTQTKNNKARVIKYMEERVDELSRGTSYLTQGSPERRQVEGKLVILKLLKVMVENDGLLSGSPKVESCVRSALVPRLNDSGNTTSTNGPIATSSYTVPGLDSLASTSEIGYPTLGLPVSDSQDSILSTTTVKASVLDKIQEFLMRGDRRKAYHYALDERLWAHALVIASSVDKEAWKEAVNEFIQAEVGSKGIANLSVGLRGKEPSTVSGREALTVAYGLYSGQGAAAIQALIPKSLGMPKMGDTLQVAPKPHLTPMSPNFAAPSAPIPAETLVHWPETAAMIIPGPSIAECSAALMALGDALLVNQWVEAAHACYLLAPQTAVLGGIGTPSARMVLVGALSPFKSPNFHVDHDAIIFSEIAEFANSLTTPAKGQEPFSGFPHLQAYKFIRATSLAELGHVQAANRYCEAISTSLNRSATYVSPDFLEQLKELSDRLIGAPQLDKSGSWIGGKMSRPSLDSLGNWLEGRFTKFIAGDGETTPEPNGHTNAVNESKSVNGPFAHYSTISSTTTSTAPSPQPTVINHNLLTDAQPNYPRRSGSAQAMRPAGNAQTQIDRASSAMEYRAFPRNSPPVPHGHPSKGYSATDYSPAGPYGYGYPPTETHPVQGTRDGAQGKAAISDANGSASNGNTWWGSSYGDDANVTTPTAATFHHVGQPPSSSGFISLMDDPTMHAPPTSEPPVSSSKLPAHDEEDDEDLGLGNSTRRRKSTDESSATSSTAKDTSSAPKASESAAPTRPGNSWFSRWWSRENTPGPVKATLGEESSFYYDKELKRWVNKKGGADASQPATPPPPPARAQTASPGRSAPRLPNGTSPAPPPARSASAMDMSGPPRRASAAAARPRSNLVPVNGETNGDSSPPGVIPTPTPPPGPSGTPPPPPSRPRSQAAKRNIRSRYVDVFQQPEA